MVFTSKIDDVFELRAARSTYQPTDWIVAIHTLESKNARHGRLQITTVRAFEGKVKILRTFTMDQDEHWDNKRRIAMEHFQLTIDDENFRRAVSEVLNQVASQAAIEDVMDS